MTKEEYEKLLKSDYWKGYSYSLIKERNFTCEDCGRTFLNERNKLQVHHLVYRDINPWSYKPEELVVLCEECHKRRHGIYTKEERPQTDGYKSILDKKFDKYFDLLNYKAPNKIKTEYILAGIAILFLLLAVRDAFHKQEPTKSNFSQTHYTRTSLDTPYKTSNDIVAQPIVETSKVPVSKITSQPAKQNEPSAINSDSNIVLAEEPVVSTVPETEQKTSEQVQITPVTETENPDRELTTLEILERKNHADVVKRAQRAGVSTEGTTLEILERINHADVVKRAQRAGVSTEGTTLEILERINHADVVKRAQRAGVSTEGTTLEILERITKKDLEKYGY